jgi:hypothetical protein
VTGIVTDGASGFGGGFGLSLPVTVRAIDPVNMGRSTMADVSGTYRLYGISGGNLTLSASAYGYETTTKTVVVSGDTRVDFALPRILKSATPDLTGVWAGRMQSSSSVWLAEFTLTQNGLSLSGTWRVPSSGPTTAEWRGTIVGNVSSDRSVTGGMTMNTPCAASSDFSWGLLDYSERYLTLSVTLTGSPGACPTGVSDLRTFFLDRTCRMTSPPGLSCAPPDPVPRAISAGNPSE